MLNTTDPFHAAAAVVAIPVRDEAERITDCLLALARQEGGAPGVLLLVNNTTDRTMEAIAEVVAGCAMPVVAIEHVFPPETANAGSARRLAMLHADRLARPGVPLLCTDADGRAAGDWLAANLYHLGHGIDAVFGRAEIDPVEGARIPPALHLADEQECAYAAALDEIEHWLDPDPDDPWPRHTEHSGASIGVSRAAYRNAGGIPEMALGEDRAFAAALRRTGARVRHAPEVRVIVSGRILGRAVGGMADTIRRRLVTPDLMLDDALEPAMARITRIRLGRAARRAFEAYAEGRQGGLRALAHWAGLDCQALAQAPTWKAASEQLDQTLPREPVPVLALSEQMAAAQRVLGQLRPEVRISETVEV